MKKFVLFACIVALALSLCACDDNGGKTELPQKVSNTILCVNFADGEDCSAEGLAQTLNQSPTGMRAFFLAESLGKCEVTSHYAGSVTTERDVTYYMPKTLFNPNGYESKKVNDRVHVDSFYREQMLVREAVAKTDFSNLNVDANADGVVDGLTIVINYDFYNESLGSQNILWPHKSELYPYGNAVENIFYIPEGFFSEGVGEEFSIPKINGAEVKAYTVVSVESSVGEICHEFSHVLGKPDYYSYVEDAGSSGFEYDNIGKFELMGSSVGDIPQFSLAHVRSKLGWLKEGEDVLVLTESATITLNPVTDGGLQAIKIIPPNFSEKGEFIMVEARRKTEGCFDSEVNRTGIIVYAVNEENAYRNSKNSFGTTDCGNMYGDGRFEIKMMLNGYYNFFNESYPETGNVKLTDDTLSGVEITDVTENENGSFTFNVRYEQPLTQAETPPTLKMIAGGNVPSFCWSTSQKGRTYLVEFKATKESSAAYATGLLPSGKDILNGNFGGYEVVSIVQKDNASGVILPKVKGETFYVIASENIDGDLIFEDSFHLIVEGEGVVGYGFGDLIKVFFKVGNPAFIATFGFFGLCVLVGFIFIIKHQIGQKNKTACPNNR